MVRIKSDLQMSRPTAQYLIKAQGISGSFPIKLPLHDISFWIIVMSIIQKD